jgi:hypothetical protein
MPDWLKLANVAFYLEDIALMMKAASCSETTVNFYTVLLNRRQPSLYSYSPP